MRMVTKVMNLVLTAIIILVTVSGLTLFVLHLVGINTYSVLSGSMEPTMHVGSIVFVNEKVEYGSLQENDIVTFEINGKNVTHRAVSVSSDGIETKGDANSHTDGVTTKQDNYKGKMLFSIPGLGYFCEYIQGMPGRFVCFFIVLMIVVASIALDYASGDKIRERNKTKADVVANPIKKRSTTVVKAEKTTKAQAKLPVGTKRVVPKKTSARKTSAKKTVVKKTTASVSRVQKKPEIKTTPSSKTTTKRTQTRSRVRR